MASAPGDALMVAACVVYHGPLDDKARLDLMHDWVDRLKQNAVDFQSYMDREPYSVTARLELLMDANQEQGQGQGQGALGQILGLPQGRHGSASVSEAASGSHGAETYQSEMSSNLPVHPQVSVAMLVLKRAERYILLMTSGCHYFNSYCNASEFRQLLLLICK